MSETPPTSASDGQQDRITSSAATIPAVEVLRRAIRAGSSFYGELTTQDAQRGLDALLAAGWTQPLAHHEGVWSVNAETGECGCECPHCFVNDECICLACDYAHDHSRREARHGK